MNPMQHRRRSIRLPGYDYVQPGAYFVTICTHKYAPLFGQVIEEKIVLNAYGEIVREEWLHTAELRDNIELDAFVVMPNHTHGIIIIIDNVGATRWVAPDEDQQPNLRASHRLAPTNRQRGPKSGSLGAIIGQLKSVATKRINSVRGTPGAPVWQRNYYEHIIRTADALDRIREYITDNPARWAEDRYYRP